MNRYFSCVFLALFAVFALGYSVEVQAASITIDHTRTDITALTAAEIVSAKNNLHIAYGHTSHGSQITDGMSELVSFANGHGKGLNLPNNIFAWNEGGTGGALDLDDYAMGGDVGYYPAWKNNTYSYLGAVNPATGRGTGSNADVNVIVWSWCGQAADYSEQKMISDYLAPMSALESTYWGVKFVYMTCHLNGTGADGQLNQRNEQIRQYCQANNKILYDFADIESYDPDGLTNYMTQLANVNCDYDSDGDGELELGIDRNWAADWQAAHTQNVDWYSCSCAHSQSLNGNQKAYAAWALWTDLAKIVTTVAWQGGNSSGPTNWSLAANWSPSASVPDGAGVAVSFGNQAAGNSVVDILGSDRTVGNITFASTTGTTIQSPDGHHLILDNNGQPSLIDVAGNHTISAEVILNNDATIDGSGILNLTGGVTGDHTLTVLGTLNTTSIQVNSLIIGSAPEAMPVPEPTTLVLLGLSSFGLLVRALRRNRKAG